MWIVIFFFLVLLAAAGYLGVTGARVVPAGHVGIVTRRYGLRQPDDRYTVSFRGGAGPQASVLRANTLYWRPRYLFTIEHVPLTHVPNGTIGVVVAKAGAIRPAGSPMAKYVECDHFRDGARFLRAGGEQGRQQQVLTSGFYEINSELFDVITVATPERAAAEGLTVHDLQEITIPIGEVGVVITHMGARPEQDRMSVGRYVPGHSSFQEPWLFLAGDGQKGVQAETLDEGGHYAINPWFAHVVRIPTRVLILEWTKDKKAASNLDISLDQIVLDVQGHTVRLDMKQTVQITPDAAPRLVRRFGDPGGTGHSFGRTPVQQFVEKELASTVASYFRKISARYRIQEFITKYDEVGAELAGEVRQALSVTGVRAVSTSLDEFVCDEPQINAIRRDIALQQERVKLEQERLAELKAHQVNEAVNAEIELQRINVEEQRRKLEHLELQMLVDLLGADHVQMERVLAQWVKADVPQIITGAGGDLAETMLQVMPFAQARDMLLAMARKRETGVAAAESREAIGEVPDGHDSVNT
ncbi:MAG TPA: SPFH domain-containing protein [Streptosporangiaceae bacterium]|nr:SPFH domain-containing protein [Streptosporangiaceae bacterium]